MPELTVCAEFDQIDLLQDFLDQQLSWQGCPTVLRLRVAMVVEELFSASIFALNGSEGFFSCYIGDAPGAVCFRFYTPQGPISLDTFALKGLLEHPSTYGLHIVLESGLCTMTANRQPDAGARLTATAYQ